MIKLTDYETGDAVYVDGAFVVAIRPADLVIAPFERQRQKERGGACTEVLLTQRVSSDGVGLLVRETPDLVYNRLEGKEPS